MFQVKYQQHFVSISIFKISFLCISLLNDDLLFNCFPKYIHDKCKLCLVLA